MRKSGPLYLLGFAAMVAGGLLHSTPTLLVGCALAGAGFIVEFVARE